MILFPFFAPVEGLEPSAGPSTIWQTLSLYPYRKPSIDRRAMDYQALSAVLLLLVRRIFQSSLPSGIAPPVSLIVAGVSLLSYVALSLASLLEFVSLALLILLLV
jgi:hypothetical protein